MSEEMQTETSPIFSFTIEEGQLLDATTGETVQDEATEHIKKALGLFSQDEVSKETAKALKSRLAEEKDRAQKKLKALQADKSASEQEKEFFKKRLDEIEQENMSAQEKIELKYKQKNLEYEQQIESIHGKYESLLKTHRDAVAKNDLIKHAVSVKANNPKVFVDLVRRHEEWIEEGEGSQKSFVPRYRMKVLNETNNSYEDAYLTGEKAVEVLAKEEPYLIQSSGQSGSGNTGHYEFGGNNSDFRSMTQEQVKNLPIDQVGKAMTPDFGR